MSPKIQVSVVLLLVLLNYSLPVFAQVDESEPENYQRICSDHPPINNNTKTDKNSKWNFEGKINERHVHVGCKNARQKYASIIHGRDVDDAKEDYSKLCTGILIEYKQEGHAEATVYGYGGEKAEMKAIVHPVTKGAFHVTFVNKANKYTVEATLFNHYVDNVIATAYCFADGKVGWSIMSTQDILKPEEKKMALEYLQKLGFNTKGEVPFYQDTCPNKFNKN